MNSAKNYTIVFHNNTPPGRSLKVAANNILGEDGPQKATIGDYYNQKFKKNQKQLEEISEEDYDDVVKKNNFLGEKSVKHEKGR